MRVFWIVNKSNYRQVVAARDEDHAIKIALQTGHIRSTKNLKMEECTKGAPSGRNISQSVLEGDRAGPMSINYGIDMQEWNINPYFEEKV